MRGERDSKLFYKGQNSGAVWKGFGIGTAALPVLALVI